MITSIISLMSILISLLTIFLFQADKINEMVGFPDFILNPDKLDEKYHDVSLQLNNDLSNSRLLVTC